MEDHILLLKLWRRNILFFQMYKLEINHIQQHMLITLSSSVIILFQDFSFLIIEKSFLQVKRIKFFPIPKVHSYAYGFL